jgi:hypothetical protein
METPAGPCDGPGRLHLPYTARRNPHGHTVRAAHLAWAARHRLAPGDGLEYAVWCHPGAAPDELALLADWYCWGTQPDGTPAERRERALADLRPRTTAGRMPDWCRRFT